MNNSRFKKAVDFHGHLGPYLVLGLLMGDLAVKKLKCKRHFGITAVIKGATKKPKSCLIDGVQLSTGCTYGKGNVRKIAGGKIQGTFRNLKSKKEIRIVLKDELATQLGSLKGHKDSEAFALKLMKTAVGKLFMIKHAVVAFVFSLLFFSSAFASNAAPKAGSISPSSGSSYAGQQIIFTTTYTDANGWKNIQGARLLINTRVNGANCFYGYYNQNTNKLYLRDNANKGWLGGYAPGSNRVIQNSYAKLNCAKTSVSGSGTGLRIKWAATFKSTFQGAKNSYLYVKDDAGAYSGWLKKGTWTIKVNHLPQINSISPANNSTFLAGAKLTIQVNASDPDNDPLQYQFSIAGTVKQPWSSLKTYIWQTSVSDTGYNNVTCEVKDSLNAKTSKTLSYSVINPTVEEILQKVASNYALIYDYKADMTLSSTLNGEPFGEPQYCRYYFKAPNKEKTETFNDSSRLVKNDIIIIDGSDMYLIDPIKNIKEQIDLLNEANISPGQFSQLDLYYNQTPFLEKHMIVKNNTKTDFNNRIIVLAATPIDQNGLYLNLELSVDYNKGLLTKIVTNKDNELPQIMEAAEIKQMDNGAWLVSKLKKIPSLQAGDFVVTLSYDAIKINTGLSDIEFDPDRQY